MTTESEPDNAQFSQADFAQALTKYDYEHTKGQTIRGKVVEHTHEGAFVDIGGKSAGFVPLAEASLERYPLLIEQLPIDDELEFVVIREQNAEGQVTLSRKQFLIQEKWETVIDMAERGVSVQVRITGMNRGGVTGDVEGLRAFIPRSHLTQRDDFESLVGQTLTVNFLEVDQDRNKLVLSQRNAARAEVMAKLQPGQLVEGKVANIKPYGIFVNLGGPTGLLHIKQVSAKRIDSLEETFEEGQSIKVMIMEVDEGRNRISLSIKALENFPGEALENMAEVFASAEDRAERARGKLNSQ
ncbi:MAG: S1 RNA-binding domain-containing protein [Cyanobacteria bacterium P01_H01_bin.15]